jgi:phospholipid/cholesterol/gamma-HCH transport system ATP-binding protein
MPGNNTNKTGNRDDSLKDPIIRINNVFFQRDDKIILNDVSMDIQRGSIVAIMGPSGVGKTTILRLISGQLQPSSGSIEVNGRQVSTLSRRELYECRKDIGVLLQNGALFTDLTVFENIATPLREHTDLTEEAISERVLAKLESVGLAGTQDLMPHSLSGGMARRVALARAVILNPKIVLFDEPMTGLDPIAMSTVGRLIRETNDQLGLTSVIVTHNVEQMKKLVDHCYILASAKLIAEGSPQALMHNTDPAVDQFMNGRVDGPISFRYQNSSGSSPVDSS